MGNRVQRQETWEANERGGDYRIKYRSWRQGEPEGGPFNTPTISSGSERNRAVSTVHRPTFKDDPRALLDSAQLEGWIMRPPSNGVLRSTSAAEIPPRSGSSTPTKRRSSLDSTVVFPPEASNSGGGDKKVQRAPSVNELILDELAKAVTDELVGPEYTPVAKPSPKPAEEPAGGRGKPADALKSGGNPLVTAVSPKSSAVVSAKGGAREEEAKEDEGESMSHVKLVINHLYAPVILKVKEHLQGLPEWYQAKTPPQEIARHIRTLLEAKRCGENEVAVSVAPQYDASHRVVPGLFVVVVCAKDRRQLLDAITRCVSTRASISEATIVTTGDGFALDRFVLSLRPDDDDGSGFDDLSYFGVSLKQDIDDVLAATPASPALPPMPPPSGKSKRKSQQPSSQSQPAPVPEAGSYTGRFEVPFQEIRLVRVLGEGRTGKTYLSDWNGQRVAAKVMSIEEQGPPTPSSAKKLKSNLDEFRRELHLVSKLSHPNIVRFVGASARPPRYILLFELCEGDLSLLIRQKDRKFSFYQVALDIANGLAFLHRNDIIHRDVKPENLMLDKNGTVKVADFGLSCYASGAAAEFTAETGTYRYMAPEVMRHEHYSFPADVYSFALVCYVLLSKRPPFDDCTPLQAALAVARQDLRPRLPSNLPRSLTDLIVASWNKDPAKRPDFESIVTELEEQRTQLNNRMRKMLDWGFHDSKKKSSIKSPFTVMSTALSATAI